MAETYPINIWINEERFKELNDAGLGSLLKEELAGMKQRSFTLSDPAAPDIDSTFHSE